MINTTRRTLEDRFVWGLVVLGGIFGALGIALAPGPGTPDSTGGSGTLRIDEATGCHYLGRWFVSPAPRVDSQGQHICTGWEGEASLLEGVTR